MKYILIYIIGFLPILLLAQDYINKLIPTEFGNTNASSIYRYNDSFFIEGIYGNNKSCILRMDNNLSLSGFQLYDSTSFSRAPINIPDNKIIAFSKNRFEEKGLEIVIINGNFKIIDKIDVESIGNFNFPGSSVSIGNNVIVTYIFESGSIRKFGIANSQLNGTIKWNNAYDSNLKYATLWDLSRTKDNHILGSYNVAYNGDFESSARVLKIDTLGNEIWKSDILPGIQENDAAVWVTELSDSNIFVTFNNNKFFDPEYFGLHPYPPTFVWLDKNGKKIREQVLKIKVNDEVFITELESGKGDFFFAYGQVREDDDFYGFITKYANNGDTIWTHKYRHPDYNDIDYFHFINDLIEEDNGDLTVLGAITPVGAATNVWAFRVNSNGCFGVEHCEQFTLADHDILVTSSNEIICYPNPTTGKVKIKGLPYSAGYDIHIYNIQGQVLRTYAETTLKEIDLSGLGQGLYLVKVSGTNFSRTLKVVKL